MAKLIKCKSCSAEVSKNAKACPQCGEPVKRRPIGCSGAISIVFLVLAIAVAWNSIMNPSPTTTGGQATTSTSVSKPSADCSKQTDRKQLIEDMIAEGYWDKVVKPAILYRVHVMPSFIRGTKFDDKQQLISVVSAYDLCEGGEGIVTVIDAMSGKEIGSFSFGRLDLD